MLVGINNEFHGVLCRVLRITPHSIFLCHKSLTVLYIHLVDLSIEWQSLSGGLLEIMLLIPLFFMHVLLVFKCLLVQNFIVFLLGAQPFSEVPIVRNLRHYVILRVGCPH